MKKMLIVAACSLFAVGAFAQTSTAKPAAKPITTTTPVSKSMPATSAKAATTTTAKPAAATMTAKPTQAPAGKPTTAPAAKSTTATTKGSTTAKPAVKHRKHHKKAAAKPATPTAPKQ